MKKKILIINSRNHHQLTGCDIYINNLMKILSENANYEIDEYAMELYHYNHIKIPLKQDNIKIICPKNKRNYIGKKEGIFRWCISNFWNVLYNVKKDINKLYDQYDLIIDNTMMLLPKKIYQKNNVILVQHLSSDFYEMKHYKWRRFIAIFILKIFRFTNGFKYAKNIIFYDEANKNYVDKNFNKQSDKNFYIIPMSFVQKKEIIKNKLKKDQLIKSNDDFKYNLIYFGRVVKSQKRVDTILKISKKLDFKIHVFGDGNLNKKEKKYPNIVFHHKYDYKKVSEFLLWSKFAILISEYEGYAITSIEAFSNGVGMMIKNSYLSAEHIIGNQNQRGILLPKKAKKKEIIQNLNRIYHMNYDEWKQISNNCFDYVSLNNDYDLFKTKWKEIVSNTLNNKKNNT